MKTRKIFCAVAALAAACASAAEKIPLPEHPRPDWQRAEWQNLNGSWHFASDKADVGVKDKWFAAADAKFPQRILVPFGWGSPASGVKDEADVGWYRRDVTVPAAWKGKRVFLVVGASDHDTSCWFGGRPRRGRAPRLAPLRQAGLRQRARHLADGLPRGPRRDVPRHGPLHAGHRQRPRDGGGDARRAREEAARGAVRLQGGGPRRTGRRGVRARPVEGAGRDSVRDDPPLGPRRPLPLRGALRAPRRRRDGRREHLLRHAQGRRGQAARHGLPIRDAQQQADLPPAHA